MASTAVLRPATYRTYSKLHQKMTTTTQSPVSFTPIAYDDASPEVREILDQVKAKFGFVPNLIASMAHSPALLQSYLQVAGQFDQTSLTPRERQLVLLTTSVENGCAYCIAAHSTIAKGMLKIDPEVVSAVRAGTAIDDPKLDALVQLVRELVNNRGHASAEATQRFLAAGYRAEQVAEVLVGIAQKTISNYFDHVSPVPLDQVFRAEAIN